MQFDQLKRRSFLASLGGAAVWPLAAGAEQTALPVIGILGTSNPQSDAFRLTAFKQGLNETGYVDGRNVAFEYRWAENKYDRLPALATELVHRQVAVIVTLGATAAAIAAKTVTKSVPIVFSVAGDPVNFGLVDGLNRPGGNATGVSVLLHLITAKQFEVLHEAVPKTDLIGLLVNPSNPSSDSDIKAAEAAAASLGHKVILVRASEQSNLETAFATLIEQRAGALLVTADLFFFSQIDQIVALAARYQLPTLCAYRDCPDAGGLISYGVNVADAHRLQGVYAGRILKGKKPADLPVQQSVKVELVINLKTAKALGITFPLSLLGRADEVIE